MTDPIDPTVALPADVTAAPPAADDAPDAPSVTRLAAILGLSRRTLYKMRERGAPGDTDEPAWRQWCARQGVAVRPPIDAGLIDFVTPPEQPADAKPSVPVNDDALAPLPDLGDATSYTQLKAREDALHKRELRRGLLRDEEIRSRVYLHRDEVTVALRAVAVLCLAEMIDLPGRLVQAMPDLEHAKRPQLRRATEAAVDGIRRHLSTCIRERLVELLNARKP